MGAALSNLGGAIPCTASSTTACLLDQNLAAATAAPGKSGFIFKVTGTASTYEAAGWPAVLNSTGTKTFCSVEDAVVRFSANTAADPAAGCAALPGLAN